ncbi:leukocyte elastase inhibitor-like [Denticeps clupeoides]|uniref:Serpin B6 n=1 Tax=Denticeps clupeoides TaxID=299321 RepID=A0AAY4BGJ1_9TELE|nr:leukocyte elastase inhibitor-like [Denticeps clupeoides]
MELLPAANTKFCLDLFKKISGANKMSNVFYSPVSISSALAMVSLGARGTTATQLNESLHFHTVKGDLHLSFNQLFSELNKKGASYALSLANRLYGDQSYQFHEAFLKDTNRHYLAELESVDFQSDPEAARMRINSWVEEQTAEKIKELLPGGTVDSLTKLLLVNAIYFKGNWEEKFTRTSESEFYLNKNDKTSVVMMHHEFDSIPMSYNEEAQCQILELPYVGKDLSMFVMLPFQIEDNTTGLQKLEQDLTHERLLALTHPDKMHKGRVMVSLPRFKMEETYNLKDVLLSMGIVDAFDPCRCDLSGMSSGRDLVMSKVVHKSFIEVNEEGTEAAAATGIQIMLCCMPPSFVADHPFLFFIRHNPTQTILFFGRFSSP